MSKTKKKNGTNGAPKRAPREAYPYDVFVKNWTKSGSVAEVVAVTGLTKNTVSAISTRLRREGVKLKLMPRRTARPIDAKALNKLVQEAQA